VETGEREPMLRDLFTEPATPAAKVIRPTKLEGLDILPTDIRFAPVAQALYTRPRREELLRRALEPVRGRYEYVVIDCPPSFGVLMEMALAAADLVIIPCQMEARATDGLVDLLTLIGVIRGEQFDAWRILLTRFDTRKTTTNQAVMAALEQWQDRILKTVIPQSEPLNQAQIERTDVYTFDPRSKGALAYQALTEEILAYGQ
jgi:chromosome partitioning protein